MNEGLIGLAKVPVQIVVYLGGRILADNIVWRTVSPNNQPLIIAGDQLFSAAIKSGAKLFAAKIKGIIPRADISPPVTISVIIAATNLGLLAAISQEVA